MRNLPAAFYKIMVADFDIQLSIPSAFASKHRDNFPRISTLLEVETNELDENHSSWDVKIEEIDNEHWFTRGWKEFAEDNDLRVFDVLVFRFIIELGIFRVTIYDRNCCQKQLPLHNITDQETAASENLSGESEETLETTDESFNEESDDVETEESGPYTEMHTSFTFTWTNYRRNRMLLTTRICKKTGLRNNETVMLTNMNGDTHEVGLYALRDGRVGFGTGWPTFVDSNNFVVGKTYKFDFIANDRGKKLLQLHEEHVCSSALTTPSFNFTMATYKRSNTTIPKSFCEKIGLENEKSIMLSNLEGEVHVVQIYRLTKGRVAMGSGWAAFLDASDLVLGGDYKFEFVADRRDKIVLQLHLIN